MSRHVFLTALWMLLTAECASAEEQTFEKTIELHVPARGALGDSPSRETQPSCVFDLPDSWTVIREPAESHGLTVVARHLERMKEKGFEVRARPRGVSIHWKLENPERFPVVGRDGRLVVSLRGARDPVPIRISSKYEAIRGRFLREHYFAGLVAATASGPPTALELSFADTTIHMGLALMAFASEARLYRALGRSTQEAETRIAEILDALDELDLSAETLYGKSAALDGFFIRDNVLSVEEPRFRDRGVERIVKSDARNPPDAAPSGDQIFGVLHGLAAVVHLAPSPELSRRARATASTIFRHVQDRNFVLRLPDSREEVKRGADMRWLSSLLHGLAKYATGEDHFSECRIEMPIASVLIPLNAVGAFWDAAGSSAATILEAEIDIPLLGRQSVNSFAAHILLCALAASEVWSQEELEAAARGCGHELSMVYYALAHGTQPVRLSYADAQRILDSCPDSGPAGALPTSSGWHKDNRWIRSKNLAEEAKAEERTLRYPGLDWLVLHNYAALVWK